MTLANWLIIAAILLGPGIALAVNRHLDRQRDLKDRQLAVFRALMATRAQTTSWRHVEALNRIDVEFSATVPKEAAVIEAWKRYLEVSTASDTPAADWATRRVEALADLLENLALVLDYRIDRDHIMRSSSQRLPVASTQLDR